MSDLSARRDTAEVIVVAHGSRATPANQAHLDLCAELAQRSDSAVHPAFLELAEPSLAETLDTVARVTNSVVVLPHFLLPGNHTQRDIPELIAAAREANPDVEFVQLAHVGASPAMIGLVLELLP